MIRLALLAALGPSLALAAIFPSDTTVKLLDGKSFKKAMKANQTSVVAFVAPWCGHCQRMAPEYSKAALGLHPLLPLYAVDCDAEPNKRLCAEQNVKGFPTIKLFPRGGQLPPMVYDSGERTASAIFHWASRRIPPVVKKLFTVEEILQWNDDPSVKSQPRALLLTKDKKIPLLWKTLGNKYQKQITLGSHRDRKGKTSVALGYEAGGKKESKVLIYAAGSNEPVLYEGITKFDALSKFFDSVLDGTADLRVVAKEAAKEPVPPTDPIEEEIARKQEAQRIALAHGGFADFIDFEKAIKEGGAAGYHGSHGYGDSLGGEARKPAASSGEEATAAKIPETETGEIPSSSAAAEECAISSTECVTPTKAAVLPVEEVEPVVSAAETGEEARPTDEL